jgi:multicomponent Na+:H+ antiporter subunit B
MTEVREGARVTEAQEAEPLHRRWLGLLLVSGVAAMLVAGFTDLPRATAKLPQLARYALEIAMPQWHTTEPVNEIVYGTRGFDTFGETFLLLAAVVSVTVLARSREPREGFVGEHLAGKREQAAEDPKPRDGWEARQARRAEEAEQDAGEQGEHGEPPAADDGDWPETPDAVPVGTRAEERAEAMTVVVRVATRIMAPPLAIAGCYLMAWGYSPGGGFPAGAVLTGVVLLLYAGFGRRRLARALRGAFLETVELLGAAFIVFVEAMGLFLRGSFTANWVHLAQPRTIRSGGVLQLFSGGELVEVATGLTLTIFAILAMRHDWTPDGDDGSEKPVE